MIKILEERQFPVGKLTLLASERISRERRSHRKHFRMVPEIPWSSREGESDAIARYTNRGIIANPNCSTIQMVVALKPIHDAVRIKRIVVSSYNASGTAKRP